MFAEVTDFLRDSAQESVIGALGDQAGQALAEGLDKELIALFSSVVQSIAQDGNDLTVNMLMQAAATIRSNKYTGPLYAIVNPKQAYGMKAALTATNAYTANTNAGNRILDQYFVGSIAGITILEHANVTVDANGDSLGCVFAPQAFGLAQRGGVTMEEQRNAAKRSTDVVLTAVAGAGILRPELAVKILTDAQV